MNGEHPVAVGNRTEARVLAALLESYDTILLPYGGNCRYDMAIETPEGLKRIQCKTGRYKSGVIAFKTASSTRHHRNGSRRPYYGEADFFGVYCPELKTTYLVPVDVCGAQNAYLRVDIPKNGQAKGVRLAADYLLTG
jgi:hypothetical protein